MSFLAEVLSSAEKVEIKEIETKIPELVILVQKCKMDVLKYTENSYVKMVQFPMEKPVLLNNARKLQTDIGNLSKTIEDVTKKNLVQASSKFKKLVTDLEIANFAVQVVLPLCEINEGLLDFDKLLQEKHYLECMELLQKITSWISSIPNDECLDALIELNITVTMKKEKLLNELHNIFNENVNMSTDNSKTVIKIKKENIEMKKALLALFSEKSLINPLVKVTSFLWNHVFVPLVDCVTVIDVKEEDCFKVLQIEKKSNKPDTYNIVFKRLEAVLHYLNQTFNFPVSADLTTLGYIGIDIRDNLSELLIHNCLQKTIPSTKEGLAEYKVVIEDTENLQKILTQCNIFAEDTVAILEYANNIDILFINKKCQEYYQEAEAIMKKDLHDMFEVGVPYDPNNPIGMSSNDFLRCCVSKSIIELITLCEGILQKAVNSSEVCAGRLFTTVQNIIHKYGNFVLEYHKKLLQTIPQQIALFHNNCKFIAHELLEWNSRYCLKLISILKLDRSLQPEMLMLQKIANESFTEFVDGQIKQINDIMKDARLTGESLDKLDPTTEKCVRQCLRQQELLKTVWSKVLSYTVYNKTLGIIFNSLCQFIVNAVVKFEDIPADVAEQLVDIIKIILNRGPKLFTDPNEISLYVISWHKINELNFILSSSLISINDRWADGKGPLALHFKSEELKQLIRALFQNTDRRSAILARIQD